MPIRHLQQIWGKKHRSQIHKTNSCICIYTCNVVTLFLNNVDGTIVNYSTGDDGTQKQIIFDCAWVFEIYLHVCSLTDPVSSLGIILVVVFYHFHNLNLQLTASEKWKIPIAAVQTMCYWHYKPTDIVTWITTMIRLFNQ